MLNSLIFWLVCCVSDFYGTNMCRFRICLYLRTGKDQLFSLNLPWVIFARSLDCNIILVSKLIGLWLSSLDLLIFSTALFSQMMDKSFSLDNDPDMTNHQKNCSHTTVEVSPVSFCFVLELDFCRHWRRIVPYSLSHLFCTFCITGQLIPLSLFYFLCLVGIPL